MSKLDPRQLLRSRGSWDLSLSAIIEVNDFISTMNTPLTTVFSISGIVFLTIAVIGQARLGFAEINPGFFGRFLALIIGIFSLSCAVLLVIFPVEMIDVVRNYVAQQLQQNLGFLSH